MNLCKYLSRKVSIACVAVELAGFATSTHAATPQSPLRDNRGAPAPISHQQALFCYFTGNGEDGLRLAASPDGLKWQALRHGASLLKPEIGGKLMRDPCILRGPDGTFHMTWTTGWWDTGIGLAHSKDLVNWSKQELLPVMAHEPNACNSWAPEIIYDPAEKQFMIFWSSTVKGLFPETIRPQSREKAPNGTPLNHRIYYTLTRDFQTYTPAALLYDPGFNCIDATIVPAAGRWLMFIKDETAAPVTKKNIRMAWADKPTGPWSAAGTPITKNWVEGPTAFKLGDEWFLYFDAYTSGHYDGLRSKDLNSWTPISKELSMPKGIHHGTAFMVPEAIASPLDKVSEPGRLVVSVDQPGARIEPTLYGVFFEDINFGADGGLYPELVKNRSFEFPNPLMGWSAIHSADAKGTLSTGDKEPFNAANPHYLRIDALNGGFGAANEGFRGMGVRQGDAYVFSAQIRTVKGAPKIRVELAAANGRVLASATLDAATPAWQKKTVTLRPDATEAKAHLNIVLQEAGCVVDLDMVSLFPEKTFKNRPNGLRDDLAQLIADIKPGFMRFPGGCIVEGRTLENRYQWKTSIGPLEERTLIINRWNTEVPGHQAPDYFQSLGLGFFEYFQFCEDMGSQPLPILNCGMACQFNSKQLAPLDQLSPYIQDALDLIEFANGSVSSPWGAKRAALGHPAPFNMKYLGIGNEQWGAEYIERYVPFAKAIKAKYPEIKLVSSAGPSPSDGRFKFAWSRLPELNADIVDEHSYGKPQWFYDSATRYDNHPLNGPKVCVGEYAAHVNDQANNLESALAEAAFMTGLERNADHVVMSAYAPLSAHVDAWQWRPNLIWFDNLTVVATPNYHVQKMFSNNRGDVVLPVKISTDGPRSPLPLYATASRDEKTGDVIVKVVNSSDKPQGTVIDLPGVLEARPEAVLEVLTGNPGDVNTTKEPTKVFPTTSRIQVAPTFNHTFPPHSVSVLRVTPTKTQIPPKTVPPGSTDYPVKPAADVFGHPLIPDLAADPDIAEFDGTFYCYATTDAGVGAGLALSGRPVVWKSKDFLNWSFQGSIFPDNFDAKYWAPGKPICKDGRYYLFPTLDEKITVVVSDSPEGPFRTLDGKDITKTSGWKPFPMPKKIDAAVFIDDDGQAYMVHQLRGICKVKPDFTAPEGEQLMVKTKQGGYSEGPYLFKRKGIYYYLYTLSGHEKYQYAYMMSRTSPLGPWEAPANDIIATTDYQKKIYGPGHGCLFNPKGTDQWLFVYLEFGRGRSTRQVWADKMEFNEDGTIKPIELTMQGVGALRPPVNTDPNLVLGKKATASSVRPDERVAPIWDPKTDRVETFNPANALDESNGTSWRPAATDTHAWYQVDLGEAREIKRTELYFFTPTQGHAYRLESSLDGNTWQPYAGHEDVKVQSPHSDVKTVRARYLKVTILKGVPGIWEFKVY